MHTFQHVHATDNDNFFFFLNSGYQTVAISKMNITLALYSLIGKYNKKARPYGSRRSYLISAKLTVLALISSQIFLTSTKTVLPSDLSGFTSEAEKRRNAAS